VFDEEEFLSVPVMMAPFNFKFGNFFLLFFNPKAVTRPSIMTDCKDNLSSFLVI